MLLKCIVGTYLELMCQGSIHLFFKVGIIVSLKCNFHFKQIFYVKLHLV